MADAFPALQVPDAQAAEFLAADAVVQERGQDGGVADPLERILSRPPGAERGPGGRPLPAYSLPRLPQCLLAWSDVVLHPSGVTPSKIPNNSDSYQRIPNKSNIGEAVPTESKFRAGR